jgi:hypothetical protein
LRLLPYQHTQKIRRRGKKKEIRITCDERHYTSLLQAATRKFTALKDPRQCPLILLVKVGWSKAERWEKKNMQAMISGLLEYAPEERI